jgi:hypothetical protein
MTHSRVTNADELTSSIQRRQKSIAIDIGDGDN